MTQILIKMDKVKAVSDVQFSKLNQRRGELNQQIFKKESIWNINQKTSRQANQETRRPDLILGHRAS